MMTDDTIDAVSKALRHAWQLGQTYWQQADSESWKQQDKADGTQKKFEALVDETRALLSASKPAAPEGWRLVPIHPAAAMKWAGSLINNQGFDFAHATYAAMLAASPAVPAQSCGDAATGIAEADRIINRLLSSDPQFDDCSDAADLIRKLVRDHRETTAELRAALAAEKVAQAEPVGYADNRGSRSPGDVMMSAHALCPDSVAGQPARMRWIADYFLKNCASPQSSQPVEAGEPTGDVK